MKQNFQNYPQQKIDACILFVFALAKQGYKPIASNNFLNEKGGPSFL